MWIPYAQGCDLSWTYSNVVVHDRSQPWAYGGMFCTQHLQNTSQIAFFGTALKRVADDLICSNKKE